MQKLFPFHICEPSEGFVGDRRLRQLVSAWSFTSCAKFAFVPYLRWHELASKSLFVVNTKSATMPQEADNVLYDTRSKENKGKSLALRMENRLSNHKPVFLLRWRSRCNRCGKERGRLATPGSGADRDGSLLKGLAMVSTTFVARTPAISKLRRKMWWAVTVARKSASVRCGLLVVPVVVTGETACNRMSASF